MKAQFDHSGQNKQNSTKITVLKASISFEDISCTFFRAIRETIAEKKSMGNFQNVAQVNQTLHSYSFLIIKNIYAFGAF